MNNFLLTMGGMTLILLVLVFVLVPEELLTKANKAPRSDKDEQD